MEVMIHRLLLVDTAVNCGKEPSPRVKDESLDELPLLDTHCMSI